ncbi:MAG: DUF721 domain-containing protein [Pleurocapsa sp.]
MSQLEQQPGWEKFREHRQLLQCWQNSVNQQTLKHTRPLYITRQVLWVATSGAARAQELSFQRYSLLKRLNKQLTFNLKDIRFSSSGWHQTTSQPEIKPSLFSITNQQKSEIALRPIVEEQEAENSQNEIVPLSASASASARAKNAAERWLKTLEHKSSSWLFCPGCNSLTPKGEIERWNLCYHCIAQKWSEEYHSPNFTQM